LGCLGPATSTSLWSLALPGELTHPCIRWETKDGAKQEQGLENGSVRARRDLSCQEGHPVRRRAGEGEPCAWAYAALTRKRCA